MDALVQLLPNLKDRFASPLTVHPNIHTYWSADAKDTLFGANHNAYSVQWTGCSIAHPAHTPEATSKAISWAIRSAQGTTSPTLTVVIAYMAPPPTKLHEDIHPALSRLLRCLSVCVTCLIACVRDSRFTLCQQH